MRRLRMPLLAGVVLAIIIGWVVSKTYWADTVLPMPPRGEALTNPFYAVQRFAEALGAHTAWDRAFTAPPADSVIVLSAWNWTLSTPRRIALERWVESGGRLVVEGTLQGFDDAFERWSGIVRQYEEPPDDEKASREPKRDELCRRFTEETHGTPSEGSGTHWVCDLDNLSSFTSEKSIEWALRDESGIQAMRVQRGRGSVTAINATPFRYRTLFDGDHGWLFVASTQLRRGDEVHFLSEDDPPSLLALLWLHGAPVVVLTLALIALVLWRGAVRLGPLAPAPHAERRSLAEQVRGTGQFALRYGGGASLHAAAVRALDEAARRRIPGYARLRSDERVAALAHLTGIDGNALDAAVRHPGVRRAHGLRNTIALLETARRRTLLELARSGHGTD